MRTAMIALLLAGAAAPALAQSADNSLPGRVDRLEKELHAVQRKVFPGGGSPEYFEPQIAPPTEAPTASGSPAQSAVADLTQRVSALEQQIAQLTNTSEQNDHRLTLVEQQLAKMQTVAAPAASAPPAPVDAGSGAPFGPAGRKPLPDGIQPAPAPYGGDTMGAEAGGSAPPPGPAAAAGPMPAKTGDPAEDGYMAGYALWSQKRYPEAETQLKQVVAKYPNHKRASYAQNLLGRAYMDDGQLTDAAKAFYASYKQFPRGDRAPDSLYYLGQTLTRLKQTDRACQVYDELRDVYGATLNPTLKGRVIQGRTDAKCGA